MNTRSWVVVRVSDGAVMFETWNSVLVSRINTRKYKAVPILEWLGAMNKKADSV